MLLTLMAPIAALGHGRPSSRNTTLASLLCCTVTVKATTTSCSIIRMGVADSNDATLGMGLRATTSVAGKALLADSAAA